eukprot:GHVL01034141.1.p1 GENE.GHVL01034141.1~~GHVL01034141.1.p1  ORF type:complete len:457 (-),score=39.43 GHVL01034141.1:678-2048(-)
MSKRKRHEDFVFFFLVINIILVTSKHPLSNNAELKKDLKDSLPPDPAVLNTSSNSKSSEFDTGSPDVSYGTSPLTDALLILTTPDDNFMATKMESSPIRHERQAAVNRLRKLANSPFHEWQNSIQEYLVLVCLSVIYFVTITLGLAMSYRLASTRHSRFKYYAAEGRPGWSTDRLSTPVVLDDDNVYLFIQTFNFRPPARLRITGWKYESDESQGMGGQVPTGAIGYASGEPLMASMTEENDRHNNGDRRRKWYDNLLIWRQPRKPSKPKLRKVLAFSYALDVEPWLPAVGPLTASIQRSVEDFVNSRNSFQVLVIDKDVHWAECNKLADYILYKLKSQGFQGDVAVTVDGGQTLSIYQNQQFANFMFSRTTKTLFAFSVFGYFFFYLPYMIYKFRRSEIRSDFKVKLDLGAYWRMIQGGVWKEGFDPLRAREENMNSSEAARVVSNCSASRVAWF